MTAAELLAEVRALGVELRAASDGSRILYHPRDALTPEWVERLRQHKPEVLALLSEVEAEVAWRVAAMRPQVPPRGAIGRLVARPDAPSVDAPRRCGSCGDPLPDDCRYVCALCQQAKWLVLNEQR